MAISVAVIGGLFPRIGAVLAFVSLAVGMAASSSYVAAALFAAVVAAWFFTCGRLSKAAAVAGSSVAALSLMGALSVLPLLSGLCLRVRDALGTTLFGIVSALLLSYCGMGSFTGGGLFCAGVACRRRGARGYRPAVQSFGVGCGRILACRCGGGRFALFPRRQGAACARHGFIYGDLGVRFRWLVLLE